MLSAIPRQIALILFALLIIGPLSVVFFATLKTTRELYGEPLALPTSPDLGNYARLFDAENMVVYFLNSVVVTLGSVFLILLCGSLGAYAISRMGGWVAAILFAFFVAGLLIAPQVYMVPLYTIVDALGLVDSLLGIILASVAFQIPICIMILTGFMRGLPRDLLDAAFVDGATEWTTFRRIVLPLLRPALATVATFSFVITWNDLLFPLLFLRTDVNKTLPLALLEFRGQYLTDYPLLFSGVIVATIPIVIAYLFLQKYFIEGMTAGSVKG